MRRTTIPILLLTLACSGYAGSDAAAAEYVRFADGRHMKIQGHQVDTDYVRLDLGRRNWIVVPAEKIELIERNRRQVYPLKRTTSAPSLPGTIARTDAQERLVMAALKSNKRAPRAKTPRNRPVPRRR